MRIYVPDEGCGFCGDQPVCAHDASEKGDHDVIPENGGISIMYILILLPAAQNLLSRECGISCIGEMRSLYRRI